MLAFGCWRLYSLILHEMGLTKSQTLHELTKKSTYLSGTELWVATAESCIMKGSTEFFMQTHRIVLGLNIPNSGTVTNQMWLQFVQEELLTRLQFCTISDAIGVYKGTTEKTKIIEVTVDNRSTHSTQIVNNLKKVGEGYKQQFRQDCVLYSYTNVEEIVFA